MNHMAIEGIDFKAVLENVQGRNCVPFVGADAGGGVASSQAMSRRLALDLGYSGPEMPFFELAQRFELARGRHDLVRKVLDWLGEQSEPTAMHHLLAELPFSFFFTTAQHSLLEQALRSKGRVVHVVVRQEETGYVTAANITVVKLLGDASQPDTLVLTKKDRRRFLKQSPLLADIVRAKLATQTLLFLDYDLAGDELDDIFFDVMAGQGRHKRSAFAVWPQPDANLQRYWEEENVRFIDCECLDVLQALHRELGRLAAEKPAAVPHVEIVPVARRPFVFLDAYRSDDADLFAGRSREITALSQKILAHRLVVLTGASGTGKSSLLQAGVGPSLGAGWRMMTARPLRDPLGEAQRALQRLAPELPSNASLKDLVLAAEVANDQRLIVVFDQFEELFLYSGEQARQDFIRQVSACIRQADLDTRFVISARDDHFVQLGALEGDLPEIFHNVFILRPLERDQALQAVLEPLHRLGLDIDDEVLDRVMRELEQPKSDGQTAIDPPQLQIVLDQLYDQMLRRGGNRITQVDYDALGGVAQALPTYLRQVMRRRPEAKGVLEVLVGEGGVKTQRSLDDIVRQLPADGSDPAATLEALIAARLVRPVQVGDAQRYELAHDVLAAAVWAWLSAGTQEAARARGLLDRSLSDWRTGRALLDAQRLDFVAGRAPFLGVLDDETKQLVLRSAVASDHDVAGWIGRLADAPLARALLLQLAVAGDQAPAVREVAVQHLGGVAREGGDGEALAALQQVVVADDDAQVRRAAAWALYRLDGAAAVAFLGGQAQTGDGEVRGRALENLAELADADVAAWRLLQGGPRRPVASRVARRRLNRQRGQIARRLVGASLGAAIGLALGTFAHVVVQEMSLEDPPPNLMSVLQLALLVALFMLVSGALAGLFTALGLAVPSALANQERRRDRAVFGGLAGAIGYGLPILLDSTFYFTQQPAAASNAVLAGFVTGLLIGVGVGLAPSAGKGARLQVIGGALGGAAGLFLAQAMSLLTEWSPGMALVAGALAGGFLGAGLLAADRIRIVIDSPEKEAAP